MDSTRPVCCLKLRDAIKEKRRGMLTRGVWLLRDNAPIHKSMIAQQAVRDCGFVQLDHPAYSSDLAPSDYFLFHNLKSHLRGVRYPDDEVGMLTGTRFPGPEFTARTRVPGNNTRTYPIPTANT